MLSASGVETLVSAAVLFYRGECTYDSEGADKKWISKIVAENHAVFMEGTGREGVQLVQRPQSGLDVHTLPSSLISDSLFGISDLHQLDRLTLLPTEKVGWLFQGGGDKKDGGRTV